MNEWPPEPTKNWELTAYAGDTHFKRQRLRHLDRIRQVLDHVRRHDYVVVLGPAYSEKTRLLYDVNERLASTDLYTPVYVNLWRVRTDDEAAFFSSLAQTICRVETISSLPYAGLELAEHVGDSDSFRSFLDTFVQNHDRHLVLLIDHLQVLPQDLTHRLLQLLRAAYMERKPITQHQIDVVVAGSAALAELSHDATSPFNMARAVFQGPLPVEASMALARANFESAQPAFSEGAVERCVYWAGGDSFLIPLLVHLCRDKLHGYRRQFITRTVVDRTAEAFLANGECEPVRAAIQAIEEDPDTVLDVVTLLRAGQLLRNEAHQTILRTGLDRLQLSGAVVLTGDVYRIKNELYHRMLRRRFGQARVAHLLRMNGRWQEAIHYLSTQLEFAPDAEEEIEASRTDLLEAVIQSIYASTDERDAYRALLEGVHLGFHLSGVRIYRAYPGRGELHLVESDQTALPGADIINLNDDALAEVRTFRRGAFALRGEIGSRRLLAALTPERRAIGIITIDQFSAETEPHVYPPILFALLRFLRHASSAIENVVMRSAIQEIGRAVLDASTLTLKLDQVLLVVLNAAGGAAAQLHLLSPERTHLLRFAYVGDTAVVRNAGDVSIELASLQHPAVTALRDNALTTARQITPPGTYTYLPLVAGGNQLGVLAVFFDEQSGGFGAEDRKTLETFADQVAIAVHNMQLLSQTSEALQEKVLQLEAMRRKAVQDRDQELQDIATALVHRIGGLTGDIPTQLDHIRAAVAGDRLAPSLQQIVSAAAAHIEKRSRRLKDLLPSLREIANLNFVTFQPVELGNLLGEVIDDLLPTPGLIDAKLHLEPDVLIEGNHNLLRDALRSLLENGCEAMPHGGQLTVRLASLPTGRAHIQIKDTGIGIADKHKSSMFHLGFSTKGENGRETNRGLGMFTCRAIVRRHGGEIDIQSQEGYGTVVTISLPLLGI